VTTSADIYIQATDTDPAVQARKGIEAENDRLLAALRPKTALLTELRLGHDAFDTARAALADFCASDLLRHLRATEEILYSPAAGAAETRLLVRSLRATVAALDDRVDRLAAVDDKDAAAALAHGIEAVLTVHLAVERAVLLPALAGLPGVDLPALAADRTTLLEGGRLNDPDSIDVRPIPHGQRHPRIFGRYARLAPGESFTLVNNHDPKPLRREFEATHPGDFTWDYLESGPEQWRVRIGRTADRG
jgi:uncharacterized protein (DUF2249 family)